MPRATGFVRKPPKRVDFLLRYTRDFPLAVVEAKASYRRSDDGMQQAKEYAAMPGLHFGYATHGREIPEFDFFTGLETELATQILTPRNHEIGEHERIHADSVA